LYREGDFWLPGKDMDIRSFWRILTAGLLTLSTTLGSALAQTKTYDCLLEPRYKIKLATPVAGVLNEVSVDRGSTVHKGQVLAKLESGVEQAMLDLARAKAESDATVKAREARIVYLTKKRDRAKELLEKGSGTPATLDETQSDLAVTNQELREAQSNMRIAQLEVARASEVLKQRSITSPIDGVVAERSLLGGEYAYEQAPIMTIAQIDPLNVEVFVPVAMYGSVKVGMEATVFGAPPVGGRYAATVEVIDPLIEARSDTFGIRLLLPNPGNKIPAGLRCKIQFPVKAEIQ